jgi:hypothetical protein
MVVLVVDPLGVLAGELERQAPVPAHADGPCSLPLVKNAWSPLCRKLLIATEISVTSGVTNHNPANIGLQPTAVGAMMSRRG